MTTNQSWSVYFPGIISWETAGVAAEEDFPPFSALDFAAVDRDILEIRQKLIHHQVFIMTDTQQRFIAFSFTAQHPST